MFRTADYSKCVVEYRMRFCHPRVDIDEAPASQNVTSTVSAPGYIFRRVQGFKSRNWFC